MIVQTDSRALLNAFYRQRGKFLLFFLPVFLAGISYAYYFATPQFESTAKLVVKFGQDAMPRFSNSNSMETTTVDEHHELLQSNANIMTSRDVLEEMLNKITIERAYPFLQQHPPLRGTLMDAAVKHMADDITVKTEGESDIMNVSLFNADPATAQAMLKRLLEVFVAKQSEIYDNPQTALLREQANIAHRKLETVQDKLNAYKQKSGISSVDEEMDLLLKQRSALSEELDTKQQTYAHLTGRHSGDPEIREIKSQLSELNRRINSMTHGKAHHDDLQREIQIAEENYKESQARLEEAEANQNMNEQKITRISVIEHPTLPYKPAKPWKALILILSLLTGLALGGAACIIAERLDRTFSLPEQAVAALGIPVLASFVYRDLPKKQIR